MAKEIISAGAKLLMGTEELTGLLTTPDLSQGDPEKIDVTTLADLSKRYINGLKDIGDGLEFEFNYESQADSSFYKLRPIEEAGTTAEFTVQLSDGLSFKFEAYVAVVLTGLAVGEQVKFKLTLTPASEIEVTIPKWN